MQSQPFEIFALTDLEKGRKAAQFPPAFSIILETVGGNLFQKLGKKEEGKKKMTFLSGGKVLDNVKEGRGKRVCVD